MSRSTAVASILCALLTLLLVAVPAVSAPAADPEARALLDRWTGAVGGSRVVGAVRTIRQLGIVDGHGVNGDMEEWLTTSGEHRQFIDFLGRWNVLTLCDGRRGWSVDADGVRHVLRSAELAAEITDIYLSTWAWLRPEEHPARFEALTPARGGAEARLRISPERGVPVTVTLDSKSGLPLRWEMPLGDRTRLTVPLDWRPVDGILVPFGYRQSTGDIRTDVVVTLREITFGGTPPADAFHPPAGPPPDTRFVAGESAVGIPLVVHASRPVVEARLNGAGPYRFVLDTAALRSLLAPGTATAAGLKVRMDTSGVAARDTPPGGRAVVGPAPLELGGASWLEARFDISDLEALSGLVGLPVDGILGVDFCERFVIRLDPGAGRLDLYDPATFTPGPDGTRIPLRRVHGLPTLEVGIEGRTTHRFLLRTNMRLPLVVAPPFLVALLRPPGGTPPLEVPIGRPLDPAKLFTLRRLERITLGGLEIPRVPAAAPPAGFLPPLGPDLAGLVGGELLEGFVIRLDLGGEELTLWPSGPPPTFAFDASGLRLDPLPGPKPLFRVAWVLPGSPAAAAGLQVGDELESIDGRKAREWTLEALERHLERPGESCRVEGRRSGKSFKAVLALRALL